MRLHAGAAASLLALAAHRRAPAPALQLSDSRFFFTSMRGDEGDARDVLLPAMTAPLAAPLWVGEVRQFEWGPVLQVRI